MAHSTHNLILTSKRTEKARTKIIAYLMILLLIIGSLNLFLPNARLPIGIITGESGAPPPNGTTVQTWHTDNDTVNRSHEVITTQKIIVNANGTMNWTNITAEINDDLIVNSKGNINFTDCNLNLSGYLNCSGNINWENVNATINGNIIVKSGGIFDIRNSTLNLTGNLEVLGDTSVRGVMNLINTTILVNCSTLGEFYIAVYDRGSLTVLLGSNITAPSNELRIRNLFVSKDSKFFAKDSRFSNIGEDTRRAGLKLENNGSEIFNCSFSNCVYAITLNENFYGTIGNCEFQKNTIGINLSNSNNNIVQNCTFLNNNLSILGKSSNFNIIENSRFLNDANNSIKLIENCNNNLIKNSVFNGDSNEYFGQAIGAISFEDRSGENTVYNCSLKNYNDFGIQCVEDSNEIEIIESDFDNNSINFKCDNSTGNKLINCTLNNASLVDISTTNASELTTLNTTLNKTKIFVDLDSNLTVQWYLHIFVQNFTFVPMSDANILIWDNANGILELNTNADEFGWAKWLILTEFYETNNTRVNLTPYGVQAWTLGYDIYNFANLTLNNSMQITIYLNRSYDFEVDLTATDIQLSNPYPLRNETVEIKVFISNYGKKDFDKNKTPVAVHFYADNTLFNVNTKLISLPVGNSTELVINWKINVTNGSHFIKVIIDPEKNVVDVNRDNNELNVELLVNSIPVAKLDVDKETVITYQDILFNAGNSYNEVEEVQVVEYYFDYGDGTNSTWISNSTIYHQYTQKGTYSARVRVRDYSGRESAWSVPKKLEILNHPPLANFTIEPVSGYVTTDFLFNPGISIDPDGTVVEYYWEFTDGIKLTNSSEMQPHRIFEDDVEYRITLTVLDNDGAKSTAFVRNLKIQNLKPIAIFKILPEGPHVSEEITFDATGSSDPDDHFSLLDFTWDFGDGTFGYNLSVVKHNYSEARNYSVTLYVQDDDGEPDVYLMIVNVTAEEPKDKTESKGDSNLFWVAAIIGTVLVIFFILIMFVFVTQTKKLRKQLDSERKLKMGTGTADITELSDKPGEFTTAGKLDFVILKKSIGKRFMKFELHKTTKSSKEFVGLIWKSAVLDGSWQVMDKILGSKEKVLDYLQLKIQANKNKNFVVDYSGNGTILSKSILTKTEIPTQPPKTPIMGTKENDTEKSSEKNQISQSDLKK